MSDLVMTLFLFTVPQGGDMSAGAGIGASSPMMPSTATAGVGVGVGIGGPGMATVPGALAPQQQPSQQQQPTPLKYGMLVKLAATSPLADNKSQLFPIATYSKHGLLCLGPPASHGEEIIFKLVRTTALSDEVHYGEPLILVDIKTNMVLNCADTKTWGTGYMCLRDKSVQGELHAVFTSDRRLGQPVYPNQEFVLRVATARDTSVQWTTVTVAKKSTSHLQGGYLMCDGSGKPTGFRAFVVDQLSTTDVLAGAYAAAATAAPSLMTPSVVRPGDPNALLQTPQSLYAAGKPAPLYGAVTPSTAVVPRPIAPQVMSSPFNQRGNPVPLFGTPALTTPSGPRGIISNDFRPLRYGDRIKLLATNQYMQEGCGAREGYVGVYEKHDLVGVGPLSSGSGFGESTFVVLSTTAPLGELVRYAVPIVLVDENDCVWNNKQTNTWADGYLAMHRRLQQDAVTGAINYPSGECHISFQPKSHELMDMPVSVDASGFSIIIEDSHRQTTKFNCKLRAYKKSSSMLRGGYLVCSPDLGVDVEFRIELVRGVKIKKPASLRRPPIPWRSPQTLNDIREDLNAALVAARTRYMLKFLTVSFAILAFASYLSPITPSTASGSTMQSQQQQQQQQRVAGALAMAFAFIWSLLAAALAPVYKLLATAGVSESTLTNGKLIGYSLASLVCWALSHHSSLKVLMPRRRYDQERMPGDPAYEPDDGENADSEPQEIVVPQRFINAEKGNIVKGRRRFLRTERWRSLNALESILQRPHALMRAIKANSNHYFYGKSKKGFYVYYETPKRVRLDVFNALNITYDDLLYHFVYITEYLYQVMDTNEDARCVSVVDCTDVGVSDLGGSVREYLMKIAAITSQHYPERSAGIIIINAPFSFQVVWKIVSAFMDPVTLEKCRLYGSKYQKDLLQLIDEDQLPIEFGGKKPYVPTIGEAIPYEIPPSAMDPKITQFKYAPRGPEEEAMFKVADTMTYEWMKANPGKPIPRGALRPLDDEK